LPDTHKIERLHLDGLADYHCHCDYSSDAKGSIDEYCDAAIERGLAEICFTTHYDSNPKYEGKPEFILVKGEKQPVKPEALAFYVEDVNRAAEKYLPMGLSVKLGLEFGWFEGCQEEVRSLKESFGFEFMLCGIHDLDNICFCCHTAFERCFSRYSMVEMVKAYVEQVIRAAESGLFNTIAHVDYIRKYGLKYYGPELEPVIKDHLPGIFPALNDSGTALEINTAGLRQGIGSYYPGMGIVNIAKRAGVDINYLGSDAHRPEQVGHDFDAAGVLVPRPIGGCESC